MEVHQLLMDFSNLGPALGSVVAMGIITFYLIKLITKLIEKMLDMFGRVGTSLSEINNTMAIHSSTLKELGGNIKNNTESTEMMVSLLKKHVYKSR